MNAEKNDLVSVVADAAMRVAADYVNRNGGSAAFDMGRLVNNLRAVLADGFAGLLKDMKDAADAFPGNDAMLKSMLAASVGALVAEAVKNYKAGN